MKTILAIIAITALESIALWHGIDGAALSISTAALAGLGGYSVAKKRQPRD